jgi:hypothetical protein
VNQRETHQGSQKKKKLYRERNKNRNRVAFSSEIMQAGKQYSG